MESCWQKVNHLSIRMALPLLVPVDSKNVVIQFFAIMPSNVPIFEKQFQNFDEFLSLAGVDIDNQVHIFFHVSADVPQTPNSIKYFVLIGGNFIFD